MSSTKADLRTAALQRRDRIDPDVRAAFKSRLATVGPRLVVEFSPRRDTLVVSLFSAIGSEPDTTALALALQAADVPLALPVDWSHGTSLIYRRWTLGDPLAMGPLGIAEPMSDAAEVEPDVLFVPVAAFDRRGHRIGYGAGNVDRTLTALRARKSVCVIGVAYAVQEELFIPSEAHDEPLDLILTERDIILCQQ